MKIVTICGSMKFENEMIKVARELETKKGFCVIQCVYNIDKAKESEQEIKNIIDAHWKKIDICDVVYVLNINGYIGESTKNEIEYAKKQGKEIIYHEKGESI